MESSLVEAWMVWPMSQGGLGLKNSMIDLYVLLRAYEQQRIAHVAVEITADTSSCMTFAEALLVDQLRHKRFKAAWDARLQYPKMGHLLSEDDYEPMDVVTEAPRTTTWTAVTKRNEPADAKASWAADEQTPAANPDDMDQDENLDSLCGEDAAFDDKSMAVSMAVSVGPRRRPKFLSFDDYALSRNTHSQFAHWNTTYDALIQSPSTPDVTKPMGLTWVPKAPLMDFNYMTPYWKTAVRMYGMQLMQAFGSLTFLSSDLIPLGMVDSFVNTKISWDQ
ncbi:hypothetical protein HDU91_003476 [Kappamyces sp. JEL0680]|nr:hypothetical protein HDU91_003476 [Kappamyces sp. JEL0680]